MPSPDQGFRHQVLRYSTSFALLFSLVSGINQVYFSMPSICSVHSAPDTVFLCFHSMEEQISAGCLYSINLMYPSANYYHHNTT